MNKQYSELKWERQDVSKSEACYHMSDEAEKILTVEFRLSDDMKDVRVWCRDGRRRNFHIEKEGLLHKKLAIINEYGIKIGEIKHEILNSSEGTILLNESKFHYSLENARIDLSSKQKNISLQCMLPDQSPSPLIGTDTSANEKRPNAFLLMAMAWLCFTPGKKINEYKPILVEA